MGYMKTFTSEQLAKYFRLAYPSNGIVTQQFGQNLADFYAKWGWKGHNGIDYSGDKQNAYACFDGTVASMKVQVDRAIPWILNIDSDQEETIDGQRIKLRASYIHIDSTQLAMGHKVKKSQIVAVTDNTGYPNYSTAPHLHFQISPLYWNGITWVVDELNGYAGGIDPQPMLSDWVIDVTRYEGQIVKSTEDPKCYLIAGGKKRWFPSQMAFWLTGRAFRTTDIWKLAPFEIAGIPDGENMADVPSEVKKEIGTYYPDLLL